MNKREIDLDAAPDTKRELRLQSEDCVISIWLPAGIRTVSAAVTALTQAGFAQAEK